MALVTIYAHLKNKIQTVTLFEDVEKTEEEDLNIDFSGFTCSIYFFSSDLCISNKCDKNCGRSTTNNYTLQRVAI
jgi:hypothetical protein